jgi:hypothetical protein
MLANARTVITDHDHASADDVAGRIIGPAWFPESFPREWWEECPDCDQPGFPLGCCMCWAARKAAA